MKDINPDSFDIRNALDAVESPAIVPCCPTESAAVFSDDSYWKLSVSWTNSTGWAPVSHGGATISLDCNCASGDAGSPDNCS